eukprot:UN03519
MTQSSSLDSDSEDDDEEPFSWIHLNTLQRKTKEQSHEITMNRKTINSFKDQLLEEKLKKEAAIKDLLSLVKVYKSSLQNMNENHEEAIESIAALEKQYGGCTKASCHIHVIKVEHSMNTPLPLARKLIT